MSPNFTKADNKPHFVKTFVENDTQMENWQLENVIRVKLLQFSSTRLNMMLIVDSYKSFGANMKNYLIQTLLEQPGSGRGNS